MKTRTTRLTLSHFEGVFEVEIIDEGAGEYVLVSCGLDRPPFEQSISIDPSEWPFLRDAIDRMFEEIAENESEGKLKELLETPAPWEKASEEQAKPDAEAPQGAASGGWIPWEGGESAPAEAEYRQVSVRLRDGVVPAKEQTGWLWDWTHYGSENDITAYKVVD
jgi:hypothetical protein